MSLSDEDIKKGILKEVRRNGYCAPSSFARTRNIFLGRVKNVIATMEPFPINKAEAAAAKGRVYKKNPLTGN